MTSDPKAADRVYKISAASLVAVIGFSLFVSWVILVCFWLIQAEDSIRMGAFERGAAFVGFPIGYLLLAFLGKNPKFNVFDTVPLLCVTGCAILLPTVALILLFFGIAPSWATSLPFFIVGIAGAILQVCWLDIFSRFKLGSVSYALGISVTIGIVVFLLVASMPVAIQNIAAIICISVSALLIRYSTMSAPGNAERAPLDSTDMKWEYAREIVPSLVMFGVVFALSFFFLPTPGEDWKMLLGLGGIALGGIAAIVVAVTVGSISITSVQRIITTLAVVTCVAMPFITPDFRLVLTFLMTGSCAFLIIENSAFLIDKICAAHKVPVFRVISRRLMAFAIGFAVGWIIATVLMFLNIGKDAIGAMRLIAAVLLVGTMMFFYPVEKHHTNDADEASAPSEKPSAHSGNSENDAEQAARAPFAPPPGIVMTESEVFERRCNAIVKLYQLSPREAEILPYLAKGRNNAFLQKQFYISQHTAKSHMYNIYRKLDIHDQQKLMDFVEEFPLEEKEEF